MKILHDYEGRSIRLTDERLAHILEHPEMVGMEAAIEETLVAPETVMASFSDENAHLESFLSRHRRRRQIRLCDCQGCWERCLRAHRLSDG